MKRLLLIAVVAGSIWAADDALLTESVVTLRPKLNVTEVTFRLDAGEVSSVHVKLVRVQEVGTNIFCEMIQTNWNRKALVAAGFVNLNDQLLVGSLEAKGKGSFKSWVLDQCGLK